MQNEIIAALIGALVAWGLSMLTIGNKLNRALAAQDLKIQNCENDIHRTQDNLASNRTETISLIGSVTQMNTEVLKTANNLIQLLTIDHALLKEKLK